MSRLNISYTVLSKRKLLKLVMNGYMRGWDDPRMPTIKGLRRRGYSPAIMNAFCREIGVTRNFNTVQYERLASVARSTLHETSPRVMAVLKPLKVILTGRDLSMKDSTTEITIADFPFDASRGSHVVHIENTIYIDRNDFRMQDEDDYFGLAPNKMVGLKYAFRIWCDEVEVDSNGEPVLLKCSILSETDRPNEKPKTSIQWVPASTAVPVEARLYSHLFTVEEPSDATWEQELNPESEVVMSSALADPSLKIHAAAEKHVQFERLGFFVFDKDCDFNNNKFVVNLTVNLKDSKPKPAAGAAGSSSANRSRKEEQERQLAEKMVCCFFFFMSILCMIEYSFPIPLFRHV